MDGLVRVTQDGQGGGGKELLDDPVVKQGIVLCFIDNQVFNLRKLRKTFNFSPKIKEGGEVFVEQVIGAQRFQDGLAETVERCRGKPQIGRASCRERV